MVDTTELQHLKDSWQTFAFQKMEQLAKIEEKAIQYKQSLQTIADWDENTEDYYGGVSINYAKMARDIIEFAKNAINNIEGDKVEQ